MAMVRANEYNDEAMTRQPEEEEERQRPRVVDRRISTRGEDADKASPPPSPPDARERAEPVPGVEQPAGTEQAPGAEQASVAEQPAGAEQPIGAEQPERIWTPEEEAEARRLAQQIAEAPAAEWILNSAVTFANVAAVKLETRNLEDARLAIDALAAIVDALEDRLEGAGPPLRETLAQLRLAYAERSAPL